MRYRKWVFWIIILLPLAITAVALPVLPDIVPIHFNSSGDINSIGSKYHLLIVPAFIVFIGLFWKLMEYVARKEDKEKGERNATVLFILNASTSVIANGLLIWLFYTAYIYE